MTDYIEEKFVMEILSTRPQCLTLEARHTISLEVAKQRRLRVASSLFIPRKSSKVNQSTQEDNMNPHTPDSSEGLRMLPWYGSGEGSPRGDSDSSNSSSSPKPQRTTEKPTGPTQSMLFGRPYESRLSLASSANHFVHSNRYTSPVAGRYPPGQAQEGQRKYESKQSARSQSCSKILSDQQSVFQNQQALSRLVGQYATPPQAQLSASVRNKAQTPCFFSESTSEPFIRATTAPTLQSFSSTFGMLNDARFARASAPLVSQENANTYRPQSSQDMSTQRRPPMSPASSFLMYGEEKVSHAPTIAASTQPQIPVSLNQNQQIAWQISNPTSEPPTNLLNQSAMANVANNTFIPQPSEVTTPAPAPGRQGQGQDQGQASDPAQDQARASAHAQAQAESLSQSQSQAQSPAKDQAPAQADAQNQARTPGPAAASTPAPASTPVSSLTPAPASTPATASTPAPASTPALASTPAPGPSSAPASGQPPAPAPTPFQINYANILKNMGLQGPPNRMQMQEAGSPKPNANENLRLLSELCQAKRMLELQAASTSNGAPDSDTKNKNKKAPATRARKPRAPRKPAASRRQPEPQNTLPPLPPIYTYHTGNQQPLGCVQQVTYIICQPGSPNLDIFPNCGHVQEVRYRPYQCIGPPAIMYHQSTSPVQAPAQPPTQPRTQPPTQPSAPEALPASLAPADMARWLASRYQQPTPQPQQGYNGMERQMSDYQHALVRYSPRPPSPTPQPPQNNQNFMRSFYEQYTEGGRFYDNSSKQTTNCWPDNRSANRNHALPRMIEPGHSNCGPQQNYYTGPRPPMMTAPSPAPMYGMGHPHQPRHANYGPVAPPQGVRFPNHNKKPMESGRVPSTISPAMGGLSINEQAPAEFYRHMVNVPEYDPRDNR